MERDAGHWPPTAVPRSQRQQLGNQIPCNAGFKVPWVNFQFSTIPFMRNQRASPAAAALGSVKISFLKAVGPHSSVLQSPWLPPCAQNKSCRGLPLMGCRPRTPPAGSLYKTGWGGGRH